MFKNIIDAVNYSSKNNEKLNQDNNKKIIYFYKILDKISEMLNENNIPFYIDCGTLLGCIREGKILSHDSDVDITIHLSLWKQLMAIDLSKYELEVKRVLEGFPNYDYGNMITIKMKNISDEYYCDIYANPAFPILEKAKMNNKEYPVPKDPGLYLKQLYGDWKVPSSRHASTHFHRNNGLILSNYKKNWDLNYNIYRCFF